MSSFGHFGEMIQIPKTDSRLSPDSIPMDLESQVTSENMPPSDATTIVQDIAALSENDPIKNYFRLLGPGCTQQTEIVGGFLEAIAARNLQWDNVTANLLTVSARKALYDPGYMLRPAGRFFQELTNIGLDYPLPTSQNDATAMMFWNITRGTRGMKGLERDLGTPDHLDSMEELLSSDEPPERLSRVASTYYSIFPTLDSRATFPGLKADWKKLKRTASVINSFFKIYRRRCYHQIFSHIERKHGLLYVHTQERRTAARNHEFPFRRFPVHEVQDSSERRACLALYECNYFCIQFYELLSSYLRGTNTLLHSDLL